jgi:hypothetical protein
MLFHNKNPNRIGLVLVLFVITTFFIFYFDNFNNSIHVRVLIRVFQNDIRPNSSNSTISSLIKPKPKEISQTIFGNKSAPSKFEAPLNKDRLASLYTNIQTSPGRFPNTYVYNMEDLFVTEGPPKNVHRFNVIRSPTLASECLHDSKSGLLILALVIIGADFFEKRQVIRQTWGNPKFTSPSDLRVLFVIGLTSNAELNSRIESEFNEYGDLIQEDYLDSYWILTIKVIGAFKWVHENCPKVRYVLRVNDHIHVNVFALINHFKNLASPNSTRYFLEKLATMSKTTTFTNTVWGVVLKASSVQRDRANKYFVPDEEFGFNYFLPYMEGSAFMMSRDLAVAVYNLSTFVDWPRFSVSLEVCV